MSAGVFYNQDGKNPDGAQVPSHPQPSYQQGGGPTYQNPNQPPQQYNTNQQPYNQYVDQAQTAPNQPVYNQYQHPGPYVQQPGPNSSYGPQPGPNSSYGPQPGPNSSYGPQPGPNYGPQPGPNSSYGPQPGPNSSYGPQQGPNYVPGQTVFVQQPQSKGIGANAGLGCLAGICLCCAMEELCEILTCCIL